MNCDLARQSIQERLDERLPHDEDLSEHIAECPKCRDYQAFFTGLEQEFHLDIPAPPQLMRRLFPKKRPWLPVALAMAGLLLIFSPSLAPSDTPGIDTALSWLGPDIEQFE